MKRVFILLQLILITFVCDAQIFGPKRSRFSSPSASSVWKFRRWEVTVGTGSSNLYGDIGGYSIGSNLLGIKDFSFKNIRFNVEGSVRYMLNSDFSIRVNFNITGLSASDSRGSNESRGLESSTYMINPDILGEYNVIKASYDGALLFSGNKKFAFINLLHSFNIYVYTGIGGAIFKVNHNTSPLASGTYSNGGFAPDIPVGFCINFAWNNRMSFGFEYAFKYAVSDYIDGYHSAYSKWNDIWHVTMLTYSYKIKTNLRGWPTFK